MREAKFELERLDSVVDAAVKACSDSVDAVTKAKHDSNNIRASIYSMSHELEEWWQSRNGTKGKA